MREIIELSTYYVEDLIGVLVNAISSLIMFLGGNLVCDYQTFLCGSKPLEQARGVKSVASFRRCKTSVVLQGLRERLEMSINA